MTKYPHHTYLRTHGFTLVTHRPLWQRVALRVASPFLVLALVGTAAGILAASFVALL